MSIFYDIDLALYMHRCIMQTQEEFGTSSIKALFLGPLEQEEIVRFVSQMPAVPMTQSEIQEIGHSDPIIMDMRLRKLFHDGIVIATVPAGFFDK